MARHFNGTSDIVFSAYGSLPTSPSAYTWAFWVNGDTAPVGSSTIKNPMAVVDNATAFSLDLAWDVAGGNPFNGLHQASGGAVSPQFSTTALGTTWYYVTATWTGVVFAIYLNGTFVTSLNNANTQNVLWHTNNCASIGNGRGTARWWAGVIADFALWSTALSASQIAALANGNRANHVAPGNMMVYWPILGLSPEPDKSNQGINGTVTGTTIVADPPQLEPYQDFYATGGNALTFADSHAPLILRRRLIRVI